VLGTQHPLPEALNADLSEVFIYSASDSAATRGFWARIGLNAVEAANVVKERLQIGLVGLD
jgi:hypothetical protein